MKSFFALIIVFFYSQLAFSQFVLPEERVQEDHSSVNFGFGLGLDYGGLGAKVSVLPIKQLALFAGLGYNFHKAGVNFGVTGRIPRDGRVVPVFTGMYGYNGVIVIQGASQFNKTYYGPTFGGGVEIHSNRREDFVNLQLFVPIRSQAFYDDWEAIKNNPAFVINTSPLPIAFCVGYHFKF